MSPAARVDPDQCTTPWGSCDGHTSPMSPEAAEWVATHVHTPAYRSGWVSTCACHYGPTGYCAAGRHDSCQAIVTYCGETFVANTRGEIRGDPEQRRVWLADRVCASACSCSCHRAAARKPVRVEQPTLF